MCKVRQSNNIVILPILSPISTTRDRNIAIEMYPSKRTEKTKLNPKIKIFVEYTVSMQKCNIRNT